MFADSNLCLIGDVNNGLLEIHFFWIIAQLDTFMSVMMLIRMSQKSMEFMVGENRGVSDQAFCMFSGFLKKVMFLDR